MYPAPSSARRSFAVAQESRLQTSAILSADCRPCATTPKMPCFTAVISVRASIRATSVSRNGVGTNPSVRPMRSYRLSGTDASLIGYSLSRNARRFGSLQHHLILHCLFLHQPCAQAGDDIRICRLVESDMVVDDPDRAQLALRGTGVAAQLSQGKELQYRALEYTKSSGARPSHRF